MKDYQASLEKLRADAAEATLIRDLPTDQQDVKRGHGQTSEALPKESGGNRYAST